MSIPEKVSPPTSLQIEPKKSARLAEKRKLREEAGTPVSEDDYYFIPLFSNKGTGARNRSGSPCNSRGTPSPQTTSTSPISVKLDRSSPTSSKQGDQISTSSGLQKGKIPANSSSGPKKSNFLTTSRTVDAKHDFSTSLIVSSQLHRPIAKSQECRSEKIDKLLIPKDVQFKDLTKTKQLESNVANEIKISTSDEYRKRLAASTSHSLMPKSVGFLLAGNRKINAPTPTSCQALSNSAAPKVLRSDQFQLKTPQPIDEKEEDALNDLDSKFIYRVKFGRNSITFPVGTDLSSISKKPLDIPKPVKCIVPECNNLKKYSCSKTKLPLCSLECYKKNLLNQTG